jgi:hypothetical protein
MSLVHNITKRYRVQTALTQLGLTNVLIPVFQNIKVTPSGSYSIQLRLQPGISIDELNEIKGKIAVAIRMDSVEFKKTSPQKVMLQAKTSLPSNLPKYPKGEE